MFDNLSDKLQGVFSNLSNRGKLSEEAVRKAEELVSKKVEKEFQQFRWKHFQGDNDNFQLMAAACPATWPYRATVELQTGFSRDFTQSRKLP